MMLIAIQLLLSEGIHPNPGPNTKELVIFQANARSLLATNENGLEEKFISLTDLVTELQLDIVCITVLEDSLRIESYHHPPFRRDRKQDRHGGVCVWVRESIIASRLFNLEPNDSECIWLDIRINNKRFIVGFYYRPPEDTLASIERFTRDLDNSISQALRLNSNGIILTGDFNAKSRSWYPNGIDNTAGTHLLNTLTDHSLTQLISGPTRFQDGHQPSLLDLLITNIPGAFTLSGPGLPLTSKCDHCSIFGQIAVTIQEQKPFERRMWFYNQIDGDKFSETFRDVNWNICSDILQIFDDTSMGYDAWTNLFMDAITSAIPNRKVKIFPQNKPWFRKEHHLRRKRVQRLYRKALTANDNNPVKWDNYKREKNEYLELCRNSKFELRNQNLTYLKKNEYSSKSWWKTTKEILGKASTNFIPPIFGNNTVYTSNLQKVDIFSEYFADIFSVDDSNATLLMHPDVAGPLL